MLSSVFWRRLAWLAVFYFFEVSFGARLAGFAPPLVLSAVVGIALQSGPGAGLGWGLAAGLLFEPFASGPVGALPFAFASAGWVTGLASSKMFGESFWVRALWPCLALAAAASIEALWGRPTGVEAGFWEIWLAVAPPQRFLVTALVTPWVASCVRAPSKSGGGVRFAYQ